MHGIALVVHYGRIGLREPRVARSPVRALSPGTPRSERLGALAGIEGGWAWGGWWPSSGADVPSDSRVTVWPMWPVSANTGNVFSSKSQDETGGCPRCAPSLLEPGAPPGAHLHRSPGSPDTKPAGTQHQAHPHMTHTRPNVRSSGLGPQTGAAVPLCPPWPGPCLVGADPSSGPHGHNLGAQIPGLRLWVQLP